jgi:hypothetical protein
MRFVYISMSVPYDERRLRRTLRFLALRQVKGLRPVGWVFAVLGLVIIALDPAAPTGYVVAFAGVLLAVVLVPMTVALSMRGQPQVVREGFHMTLDDEWVTVTHPLAESRVRWAGLGRVIETPEVWYAMFGRFQTVTIPKEPMTEEQRAELAGFIDRLQPART